SRKKVSGYITAGQMRRHRPQHRSHLFRRRALRVLQVSALSVERAAGRRRRHLRAGCRRGQGPRPHGFPGEWCGPCLMAAPEVREFVLIVKTEENPQNGGKV